MKIGTSTTLEYKFLGNYFCIIPNTRTAFVMVAKNASTFLKKVALYNKSRKWPTTSDQAHYGIGFNKSSGFLIPVSDMPEFESRYGEYVKFAVWRDPLERIMSSYRLFFLENEYRVYFQFLGLGPGTSFDRFMEFLRFEWGKSDFLLQDEHFRKQVDYYDLSQVNFVVPITKLHDFLNENGVDFIKEQSNKTIAKFELAAQDYISEIREHYADDFQIRINY